MDMNVLFVSCFLRSDVNGWHNLGTGRFVGVENAGGWCANDVAMSAWFIWDPEVSIPLGISFGWKFIIGFLLLGNVRR